MNYEHMSDFEINKSYLEWKHRNVEHSSIYELNNGRATAVVYVRRDNGESVTEELFDFNNPADAWPVIVENKISMVYDDSEHNWQVGYDFVDLAGCEGGGFDFLGPVVYKSDNPLRAAMIVFLMMQECDV